MDLIKIISIISAFFLLLSLGFVLSYPDKQIQDNEVQHSILSPDYVVIGNSDSYSPMENNIMVGEYAGWNLIKGKCNLFLGKDSGAGVMESNNKIYLESGTYDITCEEVELLRKAFK